MKVVLDIYVILGFCGLCALGSLDRDSGAVVLFFRVLLVASMKSPVCRDM